jgi:hypothetical protein
VTPKLSYTSAYYQDVTFLNKSVFKYNVPSCLSLCFATYFHVGCSLGLYFYPEDGDKFVRNVG